MINKDKVLDWIVHMDSDELAELLSAGFPCTECGIHEECSKNSSPCHVMLARWLKKGVDNESKNFR